MMDPVESKESKARLILQEREQTQELLAWLRDCLVNPSVKIRVMTWMGIAIQHRIDITLQEFPQLSRPQSDKQTLALLEHHYLPLEQQAVQQLPVVEQVYYSVIVPHWRNIVTLMLKYGATLINRKYDAANEYIVAEVYVDPKIHVEQFIRCIISEWHFCKWNDCCSLFEIKQ